MAGTADTATASTAPAAPTTSPVREKDPGTSDEVTPDGAWDVIVWDDPVNLMSYVVYVLRKIFGFPDAVAHKLMLEVHNNGKALVATEPREMAEMHVHQLHAHGLQATMQRSR
ncbi:MAG TPA: ATP-dependent Clp protease adapter ClpS [Nitriliruptorales bacterium]